MEREYQGRGDLSVPPMLDAFAVTDRGGEKKRKERKRKEKKKEKKRKEKNLIKRIKEKKGEKGERVPAGCVTVTDPPGQSLSIVQLKGKKRKEEGCRPAAVRCTTPSSSVCHKRG